LDSVTSTPHLSQITPRVHALVLAAQALPVRYRTKDARAEQAVALGLERPVVDRFRLGNFTVRPAADLLRGRDADANRVKVKFALAKSKGLERYKVLLRFLRLNRGRPRLSRPDRQSVSGKPHQLISTRSIESI